MFTHLFFHRIKTLVRDRELIFWTIAFPLILATLFNLVFANLGKPDSFSPIPAAVVADQAYQADPGLRQALETVSSGEAPLFRLQSCSLEEAQRLLAAGEIKGYITAGEPVRLHVTENGLSQSILRGFLDQYVRIRTAAATILSQRPEAGAALLLQAGAAPVFLREVPMGRAVPDAVLVMYFALFAMASLFGAYFGVNEVSDIQADLSLRAARINMSPVHKLKAFLSSSLASLLIHFGSMLVLLAYVHVVLQVRFGDQGALLVLTVFVASLTGLALGSFVAACIKGGENIKVGALTATINAGCFLAGMMYPPVKFQVAQHAPLLAWLNPVNLIADALYALYFCTGYARFAANIAALAGFTVLFWAGTYLMIRRRRYACL